jgi:transcriptional regulator with XRE-family HTH domain
MSIFSMRLKELRTEFNLTQEEFAKKISSTRAAVSSWEIDRAEPDMDTLEKIADLFDVSTDYLHGRSDIHNYKELEELKEKMATGQLKVLAAHRSDNPLDELPPKARKSLEDAIKYIREQDSKLPGGKQND